MIQISLLLRCAFTEGDLISGRSSGKIGTNDAENHACRGEAKRRLVSPVEKNLIIIESIPFSHFDSTELVAGRILTAA